MKTTRKVFKKYAPNVRYSLINLKTSVRNVVGNWKHLIFIYGKMMKHISIKAMKLREGQSPIESSLRAGELREGQSPRGTVTD